MSPLLAVAEHIKKSRKDAEFLFVGTKRGPEKMMAENAKINFVSISSGKLRRYFSWENFLAPFQILSGFFESFKILKAFKPACIFGTGSFVQVPVMWAAWMLKIPVVLHQQDLVPGLANKLCEFQAAKITVTFPQSEKSFSTSFGVLYKKRAGDKIVVTGNPFREELRTGDRVEAQKFFGLRNDLPTLLVLGGGTGAEFINKLILDSLPELSKTVQIIHSMGEGKFKPSASENYHAYKFIQNMAAAYAAADIVLCRAGLSTITELSNLKKLSIIVPMPESHQEVNGMLLAQLDAAIVVRQKKLVPQNFIGLIRKLLFAHELGETLRSNIGKIMPHDAAEKISEIIIKLAKKS